MGSVSISVNQPSGRTLIGYIQQESTGFIYNKNTGLFDELVLADVPMADRSPYRVALVESPVNTYRLTIDISSWDNGQYNFSIREYVNLVEYPDILQQGVLVEDGDQVSSSLDFRIKTAEARTLFAYLYSISKDLYYNVTSSSLEQLDLVTTSIAERSRFRVSYIETEPGSYVVSIPNTIEDGVYSLSTLELVNDVELEAGKVVNFTVRGGLRVTAPLEDTVILNHNTGGVDNLRYITQDGVAIEDARISVYLTSDISQGIYTNPIAVSSTDHSGRWTLPVKVDNSGAGAYTIIFEKSGKFGPDSVEV